MTRAHLVTAVLILATAFASGAKAEGSNFHDAAVAINATIRANHYHRDELNSDTYLKLEQEVIALGEKAASADQFVTEFNAVWRNGPFSHVGLKRAEEPAANRLAALDTQRVGPDAVTLTWRDTTAILAINTMSGVDTIQAIDAAYDEIVARKAKKFIIDLRRNGGGAFAVVPLVGHLIDTPIDAGVFVVGSWYVDHREPPGPSDFPSATPWRGYSVKAFQADVMARPLTSYRIDPLQPRFRGPVFVLTSGRSLSAAEIAADTLKSIGRAKIIGEKTPGVVLSSKLFDIPGGFHLRVPIADYYSIGGGRLEGVGVSPNIAIDADHALDVALTTP